MKHWYIRSLSDGTFALLTTTSPFASSILMGSLMTFPGTQTSSGHWNSSGPTGIVSNILKTIHASLLSLDLPSHTFYVSLPTALTKLKKIIPLLNYQLSVVLFAFCVQDLLRPPLYTLLSFAGVYHVQT